MSLWEVTFRTQYEYPFIRLSSQFPGLPISMWCHWGRELLQVPTADPAIVKDLEKGIRKAGRCIDEWADAGETRIFMLKCTCGGLDSPWNVWEKHEFMDAPPAVYKDGWGYFRLVTFNDGGIKGLFRDFGSRGPTELIRKRELSLQVLPTSIWVNSLFAEMTQKQIDALLKAHRYGYYTSPRKITTENIASAVGVSRSTYEEHLRKAENRIMEALVPYLQLYVTGEKDAEKMPTPGKADQIVAET
ncbi:MAG TPA: helix-turn-helix domain-containing protein [Thermoplasmata archaeon]|nr:helix-turn-helix domain-containing protein [Thermoplasmata archaeon]